ncbi:MAG: hypothetical protein K2I69_08430 [Muribaculaceae bacterium]|nr:hypothetical protein [Muribaculaceae bacterium]
MTFDRMEQLKGLLITLDCALVKFNKQTDINRLEELMNRLSLDYDTDDKIESECVRFINAHSDLINRAFYPKEA